MLTWKDLNKDFNKRKPVGDPVDKFFWFKKRYDLESMRKKSTNDILRSYLLANKIQYVNTYNGDVWFLFQGNWTKCEWKLVNDEIHFYIFEFVWN